MCGCEQNSDTRPREGLRREADRQSLSPAVMRRWVCATRLKLNPHQVCTALYTAGIISSLQRRYRPCFPDVEAETQKVR